MDTTPGTDPFPRDYAQARARFRSVTQAAGFLLESHSVGRSGPAGEDLTIDVAIAGSARPSRALVVSSGLHGVEGFLGSALQVKLVSGDLCAGTAPPAVRLILLHALNPFGFAWLRRVNEDNVDLNRNFLLGDEPYAGCPAGYAALDRLLNPPGPPSLLEPFALKALWQILRRGLPAVKDAVAGGQHDFPRGLFFGGHGPSITQRILAQHQSRWLAGASEALHIDFHTGLGPWGVRTLLLDQPRRGRLWKHFASGFPPGAFQRLDAGAGPAYRIRGEMDAWCRRQLPRCTYSHVGAEFGTYGLIRVLSALREENRAYHYCDRDSEPARRARARLREAFAPADPAWRQTVLRQGRELLGHAVRALAER